MSYCYNINSDGRFIDNIFKSCAGGPSLTSFPPYDKEKPPLDNIFKAVDRYEKVSLDLSKSLDSYDKIVKSIEKYKPDDFWLVRENVCTVGSVCKFCGEYCTSDVTYEVASFYPEKYAKLKKLQMAIRRAKLTIPPKYFFRDVARSSCIQSIRSFLEETARNNGTTEHPASLCETKNPNVVNGNAQIRSLFEYLLGRRQETMSWVKGSTILREYTEDVARWLLYAGSILMRCASYSDHLFILDKLLYTKLPCFGVGPSLIQFPQVAAGWSQSLVDHYLNVVHVAAGFGTIPPDLLHEENIVALFSSVTDFKSFRGSVDDEKPAIADKDLAEIFHQLNVMPFLNYVFGKLDSESKKHNAESGDDVIDGDEPVTPRSMILKLLLFVYIACKAATCINHEKTVEILFKYASIIVNKLADPYGKTIAGAYGGENLEYAVLNMAYAIVHTKVSDMWYFLENLPFQVLSERSSWEMLSILHTLPPSKHAHCSEEWENLVKGPGGNNGNNWTDDTGDGDEWVIVKDDRTKSRKSERIDNNVLDADIIEAAKTINNLQCAVTAIWALSENHSRKLAQACIDSLFGFIFERGATDKRIADPIIDFISATCSKDISFISHIIDLFPVGFEAGKVEPPLYIQLVDSIPFGDWNPEPEHARKVAMWVRKPIKSPGNETGKRIIDTVRWPGASIEINRSVAYALVRAVRHHHIHGNPLVLRASQGELDFKEYCSWSAKALGSLLYYNIGAADSVPQKGSDNSIGGEGVADDVSTVEYISEILLGELREADKKGSIADVFKSTSPVDFFALFMLAPFGSDLNAWAHESSLIMKLLREFMKIPDVDDLKTPVLCQLVPYIFANIEDKEAFKESIIPDFRVMILEYLESKTSDTSPQKIRSDAFDRACYQLISRQIDAYPPDTARAFCGFWIKVATYQNGFSDIPSLAILSVLLQSWAVLKNGEIPPPVYEEAILPQIRSCVNSKFISTIPLKVRGIMSNSPLPNFPYMIFGTLCK